MTGTLRPRARAASTSSKHLSMVTPARRATVLAAWMVPPSARGSEKGMPTSMMSEPAASMARRMSGVDSRAGYPAVMKGTNATRPSSLHLANAAAIASDIAALVLLPLEVATGKSGRLPVLRAGSKQSISDCRHPDRGATSAPTTRTTCDNRRGKQKLPGLGARFFPSFGLGRAVLDAHGHAHRGKRLEDAGNCSSRSVHVDPQPRGGVKVFEASTSLVG